MSKQHGRLSTGRAERGTSTSLQFAQLVEVSTKDCLRQDLKTTSKLMLVRTDSICFPQCHKLDP
eukprot:5504168-Amphidinium_carterae.1